VQICEEGEDISKLLVGIAWKPPTVQTENLVLDLSVLLFDEKWQFVGDCSWVSLGSKREISDDIWNNCTLENSCRAY
jgi:hypothetical protein